MLQNKVVLIGVCGGIAAYKTADLVSRLRKQGAEVHVVMTRAATRFITPLTLAALSQNPVAVEMFGEEHISRIPHIELAQKAQLIVIAPATANIIGKIANGIADDLLSTLVMAAVSPVAIAPAMNVHMYRNPVLQKNLERLRSFGYHIIEPAEGILACGDRGPGRLPEPPELVEWIERFFEKQQDLSGKKILVTAGGTREAIDPVRFITNRSTGKMGYAVAAAARDRGAEVILVSAASMLEPPAGVRTVAVESAREMYEAVMSFFPDCDAVIKAAAVADYRPRAAAPQKIKKGAGPLVIELERNPDILYELGQRKQHQVLVGFAAETHNLEEYAREKMAQKNLDMIVANDVTREGAGFGVETNIVTFFFPGGEKRELPQMKKSEVAHRILDEVLAILKAKEAKTL